jgi:hypothetical protein
MSAWRTWSGLSRRERVLLVQAGALVGTVRVALWVLPSRWIIKYVTQLAGESAMRRPPSGHLRDVLWAVEAASRRMPDASCLTQAVTALLLMRRHGYAARFCVGVARAPGGTLDAHAWLERDGAIVIGRMAQPFVRLPDLART